jgi:allantoinase
MCDSGLPEFPRADDLTLLEGLREAARLELPVAVHAESHELTQELRHRMLYEGRSSIRDFLASRPIVAELEAIQRATLLAGEAGAKLHIVHVSSGRGVVAAAQARARGVDVSIETCPHYLFFTEEDVVRLGAIAKCAPPLREKSEQDNLWAQLLAGVVDIVASDHSPAPPEMKSGEFIQAWGGIAGVQSTLAVLLDRGHHARALPFERIGSLIAGKPACRFRIPHKGRLVPGADADLAIVDVSGSFDLHAEDLMQRHRQSPYVGASFRGKVERTIRRGETIFMNGKIDARSRGVLVRPA